MYLHLSNGDYNKEGDIHDVQFEFETGLSKWIYITREKIKDHQFGNIMNASLHNAGRVTWDEEFMNLAIMASLRTSCKHHRTGCIITDQTKRVIALGYNGSTEGDLHCCDVGCAKVEGNPKTGKLERRRGSHAEINAIINCQDTKRLRGASLYTVLFPCYDCMKAINNAGIKEIVYLEEYKRVQTGGEKFEEENEARDLANKRSIVIKKFNGRILVNEVS